jgi:tRNA-splicing ligase RtcB
VKGRELENLGLPRGPALKLAQRQLGRAAGAGLDRAALRARVQAVITDPASHVQDEHFGELARQLLALRPETPTYAARQTPAPWSQWGLGLEPESVRQMASACALPVAIRGALMPDAHVGYGLPIGGVLATDHAVIPYAVGVDIACRMKLTVLDVPPKMIESEPKRLINAIERETRFGIGAEFRKPHEHDVLDRDWSVTAITRALKDKARAQLGTSGSGNHFVEFGTLTLAPGCEDPNTGFALAPGTYLALLSHSGSRGTGAAVADFYSKAAMSLHPELPRELKHLAWLDLASEAGQEYWAAMTLMGHYAAANHAIIHRMIARHLGARVLADIENHHNFAWKEVHEDPAGGHVHRRDMIVHRKGATPAGPGALGIIPGSMASPGFVVRGRGAPESLHSASHGAGRTMSRTRARQSSTWATVKKQLAAQGITLISAGLDEVPGAYKDIHQVMDQQRDLVDVIARFDPRIVKMAPGSERAED